MMKGLRKATEDEARYIKKHIGAGERVGITISVIVIIGILAGIAIMIKTLINKGSVPFAIFSIIVQLGMLGFVYLCIRLIRDSARKLRTVRKGDYLITDCTVTDVKVETSYKRTRSRIRVETSEGKKYTFASGDTYGPASRKGRRAYIVEIGSGEEEKYVLIPRKE